MNIIDKNYPIRLFSSKAEKIIVLFNSASLLIFAILSLFGGLGVIILSALLFLITIPIVSFFQNMSKIHGLINGFIFTITIKSFFLLSKLIVLVENPINALIIGGDSQGYILAAFKTNIAELVLEYGTDLGFVFFLKAIAIIFDISSSDIPVVFVLPNIFATSLIIIFSISLARKLMPYIKSNYIFWIGNLDFLMINFSTVVLKDALVSTFTSVSLVIFITKRRAIIQTLLWGLSLIGSFVLRFRSAAIIAGMLIIRILFSGELTKKTRTIYASLASLILVLSLLVGRIEEGINVLNRGKSIRDTEQSINEKILAKSDGNLKRGGRLGYAISSLPSFPLRVSLRSTLSFLAPIPPLQFFQFQWGTGPNHKQARFFRDLGGISWYLFMPFVLLGAMSSLREKDYFLPLSLFVVILAMGVGGWVDPRIRLMASVPVYLLIAKGMHQRRFFNLFTSSFYIALLISWCIYEILF